ncbi:MAG: hypothetical protein IJH04_11925 [Eggerthellaceae bacterium]|nr:hypothetical protein [Eggerthellaceae bacterium]
MMQGMLTRRQFVFVSAAALSALALSGCSGNAEQSPAPNESLGSKPEPTSTASAADNPSSAPEASVGAPSAQTAPQANSSGGKILVACFSATGNTRAVAQTAAAQLKADYFEVEAAVPYSSKDLDYGDSSTRATVEHNDPSARPAIANAPDLSAYDVVLIGHPIGWGKAPRLSCTLIESVDFAGKKVAEFCTSGSSGVEGAAAELEGMLPGADWIGAKRFAAGASDSDIANWLDSLAL